jgi:hypothetical protein
MRRSAAYLVLFALLAPAGLTAFARPDVERCAMACHSGGEASGAVCCLVGGGAEGPVLKVCTKSRDGMPLPPTCRLAPPRAVAALGLPGDAGMIRAQVPGRAVSRPHEPADPVPLLLS